MRLSIRDLLWAVTVSALVIGWWLDRHRASLLNESNAKEVERWRERCMTMAELIREGGGSVDWGENSSSVIDGDGNSRSYHRLTPDGTN